MGNLCPTCFRRRQIRRRIVLLLIGLDNAGKTQTMNNLVGDDDISVLPTVGFKAVNLIHRNTPVTIYDLGGSPQFRQIWSQYYSEVYGIIFVIDSSDLSRLNECRTVLEEVLSHDKISGKPVLILANKQDKSGALDDLDIVEKLNIEPIVNKYRCPTLVESYTANPAPAEQTQKRKLDPGLKRGYLWLLNYIIFRYGDINLRVQTDIHSELERRKGKNVAMAINNNLAEKPRENLVSKTGFDNPNYTLTRRPKSDTPVMQINPYETGFIVVKPIRPEQEDDSNYNAQTESIDTLNFESPIGSNSFSNRQLKLSPLFGKTSAFDESWKQSKIDLEPRYNVTKLIPITIKKNSSAKERKSDIELEFVADGIREQSRSSPAVHTQIRQQRLDDLMEAKKLSSSNESHVDVTSLESVEEGRTKSGESGGLMFADGPRAERQKSGSYGGLETSPQSRSAVEFVQIEREVTMLAHTKSTRSDTSFPAVAAANTRPASASLAVRRQLELVGPIQRRKLSLKSRNKTSPEQWGIFHYDPAVGTKEHRKSRGDFETSAELNYLSSN